MFKIMNKEASNYLINLIPKCQQLIRIRNSQMSVFYCQMDCLKHYFFPSTLNNWFNLDDSTRNSESISIFKSRLLSFISPVQSKYHNIFDLTGLKFLIRLVLGFSHLNEHRFRHNFQDCMNLLCSCSLEAEDILHCHCHYFSQFYNDLMNSVKSVSDNFESFPDKVKKDVLLYGD